jgi:hypothetical protein
MKTKSNTKKSKSIVNSKEKQTTVPYSYKPIDLSVEEWQTALRKQFAVIQNFEVKNLGTEPVFSDFSVYNPISQNTYKVAIRSDSPGLNFCSCPDFKVNYLGTCKHIEYLLQKINSDTQNRYILSKGNIQYYSSISLKYGAERKVYLRIGENNHEAIKKLSKRYFDKNGFLKTAAFNTFENFYNKCLLLDEDFRCYSDAMDFILEVRSNNKRKDLIKQKFSDGIDSPVFDNLIKAKLYPYQKEGILFVVNAGRSLLADDMGLGKTIQAIGATEIFANELQVNKVLIVCPTSLKYQWKTEIEKFSERSVQVIEGMINKRKIQYLSDSFYKITSYNSIKNDLNSINDFTPDLVILDEAQRIKNWKTMTAQSVKKIESQYAIVLTGTPLENRLDELHSLIQFVDKYKLGALFQFLNKHQIINDESGKLEGYKNLNSIISTLEPILLRRKKSDVLIQLPERIDKNYFVEATPEQMEIHNDYSDMVAKLVYKWRKNRFLNEPDRKRLMLGLSCMRMVCDSTYILDQTTRHDIKINELVIMLEEIFDNSDDKVVIFSQWERMTRLVAQELDNMEIKYEYLHGGIPSNKRKDLLTNFSDNPLSRVFLSTDAGGVGLNLQKANIIINLDIPWNPAVLEQRIARVYRMGQGKHVRVVNFVTQNTIEHQILNLLNFKKSVFEGVLDHGDDTVFVNENKFNKIMEVIQDLTEPTYNIETVITEDISENETYGTATENLDLTVVEDIPVVEDMPLVEAVTTVEDTQVANNNEINGNSTTEKINSENDIQTESKIPQQDNNIQELISTGISFIQKLSQSFSDKESTKNLVSSFVQKDEITGKLNLNIPINDENIVEKAVDLLDSIFKMFKK